MEWKEACSWLAYATRLDEASIIALMLTDKQLINIGYHLSLNTLLNPPRERKLKAITFMCACPCNQMHSTTYRTKKPKYINAAHRQRAARAGSTERREISAAPSMCTMCMVTATVNAESVIEAERHMCQRCLEGML